MDALPFLKRMPAAAYHADPCPVPSLSASVATVLVRDSAYHAWLRHPRLGGVEAEATEDMQRGTLLHALVFGTDPRAAVIDARDYRSKTAQEDRDAALAAGQIPVLAHKWDDLQKVAAAIREAVAAEGFDLSAGVSEVAAFWEEPTAHGPVLCRGMFDHLFQARAAVLDLKTSRSAAPEKFARSAVEHGYDVQHAAYTSALRKLYPHRAGRESFAWLVVEELPAGSPKRVVLSALEPDGEFAELGRRKWERACARWAECLKTNRWPGYVDGGVFKIPAPAWALKEEGL